MKGEPLEPTIDQINMGTRGTPQTHNKGNEPKSHNHRAICLANELRVNSTLKPQELERIKKYWEDRNQFTKKVGASKYAYKEEPQIQQPNQDGDDQPDGPSVLAT
ncbi:hypothetical protein G9A89_000459 [Geosiphon pyriformis]|nr:hypothetical protein G9A89_000459 [Geosiphon pyriformis]